MALVSNVIILLLHYIDEVEICRLFICAAKTTNRELHVFSTSKNMNLFAATGYVHYGKPSRIYLQLLVSLEHTHPWFYPRFTIGLFVFRRSKRFWTCLLLDLSIEQAMMRKLQSHGGLTRESGFAWGVQTLWVCSIYTALSHKLST